MRCHNADGLKPFECSDDLDSVRGDDGAGVEDERFTITFDDVGIRAWAGVETRVRSKYP
jgi:hypothetical protein